MTYTTPFTELNKSNIPTAGGKGANLGELTAAGFPIPAGFVLTTAAYNVFVAVNGLQAQIIALAHEGDSAEITSLFQNADIPEDISAEIITAWQSLDAAAVAVRSSATAEDLPTSSFAGQQDTFLNIRDEAALLAAVKKCWASLWTARAIAYRQRQGIAPEAVSLAVVVQALVDAESSGILFSADPTTGERDHILINATWGLGEAIVGGLVTPDTVVVDKSSWQIVSRETATKTVMTARTETGTEEQPVPEAQQNQPVLDNATAIQLAQIGAKIEAHYGMPMDIEWATANGEMAILQARPITALRAAPLKNVVWKPPAPNTIWARRQIVEHMPEPLSPLFADLYLTTGLDLALIEMFDNMERVSNAKFSMSEFMPHSWAQTINGYAYTTASATLNANLVWQIVKIYARIYKLFSLPELDWDAYVLPTYQSIIARWDAVDLEMAQDATLLQGIGELAAADCSYWFGSAVNLGLSRALDPLFDKLLKSPLFRAALPRPDLGSSSFLRGFDSKALDAQADMEALANTIRASEQLREIVLQTSADQLLTTLANHPAGQPVLDGIHDYLAEYGHQIYNLDFVAPTQSEDPLPLLLSLKALVKTPPTEAVRTRQRKMATERDRLVEQTANALNPVSRQLFRLVWKWTKMYGPYREHVMFYMGAGWPTVRKLAHELGQRLTDAGAIAQPNDIYYLNSDEIRAAIAAGATGSADSDFIKLTQDRRDLRERRKLLTPPPIVPVAAPLKVGPIDLSIFAPTPETAGSDGPVLDGYAVSTGKVTAPASVIHSTADFDKMQPNSILVCTTTTPAWTPLFSQAVGLVTDVGGALAHGSIVAREYGIPAVMGTGVATERIQSGMMLAIDGDKGTVTLLDEVDETTVSPQIDDDKTAIKHRKNVRVALAIGALAGLILWRRRG